MALKAFLKSLDDLDENARALYRQVDGGFVLDVEKSDGYELANTGGLTTALDRERAFRRSAESWIKGLGGEYDETSHTISGGPDADRLARLDTVEKELADLKAIDPKKEADKLVDERVRLAVEPLKNEHVKELGTRDEKITALQNQTYRLQRDGEALSALIELGGNPQILLPAIRERTRMRVGDDGTVGTDVLGTDGQVMHTTDASAATVTDLVKTFAEEGSGFESAFKGEGHSGGGTGPGKPKPNGSGNYTQQQLDSMPMSEYRKLRESGQIA